MTAVVGIAFIMASARFCQQLCQRFLYCMCGSMHACADACLHLRGLGLQLVKQTLATNTLGTPTHTIYACLAVCFPPAGCAPGIPSELCPSWMRRALHPCSCWAGRWWHGIIPRRGCESVTASRLRASLCRLGWPASSCTLDWSCRVFCS